MACVGGVQVCGRIHVHGHMSMYEYVRACVHVCVCVCVQAYIYTYVHVGAYIVCVSVHVSVMKTNMTYLCLSNWFLADKFLQTFQLGLQLLHFPLCHKHLKPLFFQSVLQ